MSILEFMNLVINHSQTSEEGRPRMLMSISRESVAKT